MDVMDGRELVYIISNIFFEDCMYLYDCSLIYVILIRFFVVWWFILIYINYKYIVWFILDFFWFIIFIVFLDDIGFVFINRCI